MLIISSTGVGLHFYNQQKIRLEICKELNLFCDSLVIDLNYSATPIKELLESSLKDYKKIDFIDLDCVETKKLFDSSLNSRENYEISKYIYSLGKSDVKTQLKLINSFKEYINSLINKYQDELNKKGKLYVCFSSFVGIMISIILL